VYVADSANNRIRKISPGGVVSTLAGSGASAFANGIGAGASFDTPSGVSFDTSGNVYVADSTNNCIRKISPGGVVSTLAGSGTGAFANGIGAGASFYLPFGVAVDTSGNVYVADSANSRIRKISPGGVVSTLAGSGTGTFADGIGTGATFHTPFGVALDTSGNCYVADWGHNRIRKISPGGVVTTLASFKYPSRVTVDSSGNVYVADSANNRIRKISSGGDVSTLAGSGAGTFADGSGAVASFNGPRGMALDTSGNLYVADSANHRIRKLSFTEGCPVGTECIDPVSPLPCPVNTRCIPCSNVRLSVGFQ